MKIATREQWASSISEVVTDALEYDINDPIREVLGLLVGVATRVGPIGPDGTIETLHTQVGIVVNEGGVIVVKHAITMVIRDMVRMHRIARDRQDQAEVEIGFATAELMAMVYISTFM